MYLRSREWDGRGKEGAKLRSLYVGFVEWGLPYCETRGDSALRGGRFDGSWASKLVSQLQIAFAFEIFEPQILLSQCANPKSVGGWTDLGPGGLGLGE
jgi:hypothetical protein